MHDSIWRALVRFIRRARTRCSSTTAPVVIDVVFDALEELRVEGVTILLVEQNVARAVEFADRAYILRSGKMAHSGTRDEILRMEDFETAYLGV